MNKKKVVIKGLSLYSVFNYFFRDLMKISCKNSIDALNPFFRDERKAPPLLYKKVLSKSVKLALARMRQMSDLRLSALFPEQLAPKVMQKLLDPFRN